MLLFVLFALFDFSVSSAISLNSYQKPVADSHGEKFNLKYLRAKQSMEKKQKVFKRKIVDSWIK